MFFSIVPEPLIFWPYKILRERKGSLKTLVFVLMNNLTWLFSYPQKNDKKFTEKNMFHARPYFNINIQSTFRNPAKISPLAVGL